MSLTDSHFIVGSSPSHLPWASDCAIGNFTNCTLPGIDGDLLLTLAKLLNFTFTVILLEKPSNLSHQLTWDETFAYYLDKGAIDFTMNSMAISSERMRDLGVVFGAQLIYTDRGFMMRQPTRDLRFLLTRPFDSQVWLCLVGTVLLLTFLCALVWSKNIIQDSSLSGCVDGCRLRTFMTSFWTVGMITLQQSLPGSYYLHKRPYTQKLLVAVWIGASFILASSYGAMLISVLLDIRTDVMPFQNVKELAHIIENHGYRLIVPESEMKGFQTWKEVLGTRPSFQEYIQSLERYPPLTAGSFQDLLDRVLADPYLIYPCRLTEIQYRLKNIRCNVTFVRSWEEAIATSLGFRRAVYDNILQNYLGTAICDPKSTDMSLSVRQLQGGFILLIGGAILAAGLFTFEALSKLFRKNRQSENFSFSSAETASASAQDHGMSDAFQGSNKKTL